MHITQSKQIQDIISKQIQDIKYIQICTIDLEVTYTKGSMILVGILLLIGLEGHQVFI